MNAQRAPLQEDDDPVPPKWRTRWYFTRLRFLRFLSRLLRMPAPLEVNQALESWGWKNFQKGRGHYLGHCPFHPEEIALYGVGQGYFLCYSCSDEAYLRSLDNGPHTDQARAVVVGPPRPMQAYRLRTHPQANPETQEHRATWGTGQAMPGLVTRSLKGLKEVR